MALTIDGSDPTGDLGDLLAAKLAVAGGKILQIVRATDATDRSTSSGSFVDASLSVTITPQKSDSAILLMWTATFETSGVSTHLTQITDNSNNAISGGQGNRFTMTGASHSATWFTFAYATPATTSAVTFKARFAAQAGAGTTFTIKNTNSTGQLFALEISA